MSEPKRRAGATAVHSVNRVVFTVPKIEEAERFYRTFGLDVRRDGERIDLYTFGHPHCWASIHANGRPKKLQYLSFGVFEEDLPHFRKFASEQAHPLSDGRGIWTKNPDGIAVQLVQAPKVSPSSPCQHLPAPVRTPGVGLAPARSKVKPVHPRHLSHALCFSPDVPRMTRWCQEVLGLRVSDTSLDIVAFMHGAHGSDHHMFGLAKSNGPGLHHLSWDVGSIDEVGNGAEQCRNAGYTEGWGVGRHVIGSNYFYYARDPWGSFCEYSFDIDHIPADLDWKAGEHPPEDSLYVWGPSVPENFVVNHEMA